jgi:hypothetical protein
MSADGTEPQMTPSDIGPGGICWAQSDKSLGWTIRRIESVGNGGVTLNDGVTFYSPCFAGAAAGDIWAVCHEAGVTCGCFGEVRRAVLLEPARKVFIREGSKQ